MSDYFIILQCHTGSEASDKTKIAQGNIEVFQSMCVEWLPVTFEISYSNVLIKGGAGSPAVQSSVYTLRWLSAVLLTTRKYWYNPESSLIQMFM